MTDKQIIIDNYFIEVTDEGGGTIDYTIIPYTAYQLIKDIQEQNNYIKRKEQECEKWKNAYEVKEDALEEAEEDTEELEEKYHKLQQQLDQLKAENEELKKELQAQRAFTRHEQKLIYCVAYDETCKTGNDCKQKKCIFKDNIKLKQTLTEIKEYCTEQNLKADWTACEILQKISEVLDE